MRSTILIAGTIAFCALLTAVAFSQDKEKPLAEITDPMVLVEKLGDEDYQVRKAAEESLLKLGPKAAPALRDAAKNHEDAHVRFEAERILERLGQRGESPLVEEELAPPQPDRFPGRSSDFLEKMLRRLEEQGMLPPGQLERMREMLERPMPDPGSVPGFSGTIKGAVQNGDRKIEWEQHLDGRIKVTVTREGETEVHEAKNLEELKAKAPEVYEEIRPHLGSISILRTPMNDQSLRELMERQRKMMEELTDREGDWWKKMQERSRRWWDDLPDWPEFPRPGTERTRPVPAPETEREAPPGGFRLGVWIADMPEALREHLAIPAGTGVLIDDVVPGSLADRMGLRRMDIIRTINGDKVGSSGDIRDALATVSEGEKVEADIIRRGQPMKLMTTR